MEPENYLKHFKVLYLNFELMNMWALIFDSNFDLVHNQTQIFDLTFDLIKYITQIIDLTFDLNLKVNFEQVVVD